MGEYEFKLDNDLDFTGGGKTQKDAVNKAFEIIKKETGLTIDDFKVEKWGVDKNGKSFPVEWRAKNGAEVNIDWSHTGDAPRAPHIGYQLPGKRGKGGAKRGQIFVDEVKYNRGKDFRDEIF